MLDGLWTEIALFVGAAGAIGFFGIRMTHLARELAIATGLGDAFMGAVFIGATTSLSGIVASATAALHGEAGLAVSNSLGGGSGSRRSSWSWGTRSTARPTSSSRPHPPRT